ncbi:Ig domain-containing protein [Leptospira ognonensis]|uniref:Ig domain-containing protein n=1 Tax=Leptospira ognonensis TaxID=2484945 RepID=UPI0014382D9B|nr:Ig domain-containing protein [Leptospira ognonensis]
MSDLKNTSFVFFVLLFFVSSCQPLNFSNSGDFNSPEFYKSQLMGCLLKSVSCTDNQNESQGQGQSQNENQNEPTENQPNNTTGSAPNINYSEALYPLFRNFSISTITPTVTGTVTSCSSNPALPSGLSLHPTSCTITGTPTTDHPSVCHFVCHHSNKSVWL